jgi:ATP/maltotriose-dependent transcriptional regulator MalT
MRGEAAVAEAAAARAEHVGRRAGNKLTTALAQLGPVLGALGDSRYADAYAIAHRLFDPADPAYHPVVARWLLADLAEAALHTDRVRDARELLLRIEATTREPRSSWIDLQLHRARALLARDDDSAQTCFDNALRADLDRWPFQRARLQLAYGEWLRRQRRITDSRAPLRSARDLFDTLGCVSWSERARRELRASGERSRRHEPSHRDRLTAQELQIAQLAADGFSNREIGERLYLSHRTISTHLYRIFPKLGITARGQLGAALSDAGTPTDPMTRLS